MAFTNLYYKRTAATAKACYVCYKPTTTVLATINTIDFLYTCPGHLSDVGFASVVGETSDGLSVARKVGLSPEEIAKVKEEWEEKQKKKAEKEKDKEKEKAKKEDKKDEQDKDNDKDKAKQKVEEKTKTPTSPNSTPSAVTPSITHQRYTLHRDYFAMRLAEHRKRRQIAQAKELAPRLPGAPRGPLDTY